MIPKSKPIESPGHCTWVKQFGCTVQNQDCFGIIETHHVKTKGAGGGDEQVIPLCTKHHKEWHDNGRKTFAKRYSINAEEIAAKLWRRDVANRTKWEKDNAND